MSLSTQFAQNCPDQDLECCPKKVLTCCQEVHEKRLCLHSGKVICTSCQKCKPKKSKKCCCPKQKVKKVKNSCGC